MSAIVSNFWFRHGAYALLHSVCLFLGISPFDVWPCAFGAVFFLYLAAYELRGANFRRILASGVLFAFALTLVTFSWIVSTIHRFTGEHVALTFFLTIGYAVVFQAKAFFLLLAYRFAFANHEKGVFFGLALAALVAVIDALSPELFPWSWGNALSGEVHFRQLAAIGSVYLLSFVAAFGGWILFRFFILLKGDRFRARLRSALPEAAGLVFLFAIGAVLRYGFAGAEKPEKLRVLIIQTNIGAAPEGKRGDAAFATDAINRLFNQSAEGLVLHPQADLIIWPEASMPFHSSDSGGTNTAIYSPTFDGVLHYLSRRSGAAIVYQDMGFVGNKMHSRFVTRPSSGKAYLKRRLVPWGEYLPFESLLPSLRKAFPEAGRFTAGTKNNELSVRFALQKPNPLSKESLAADLSIMGSPQQIIARYGPGQDVQELPVKPLLCYEALFPADARTQAASLIVNLSSDAWFGDGIEGHQHAGAAMLRAVENGIPMVRAAMSGVSMVADNRGELLTRPTGQGNPETQYAEIPLRKRATIFSRFGMIAFYLLMLVALFPYLGERFIFSRTRENK